MRRLVIAAIPLIALVAEVHAEADSLNDHLGPREIGTGEAMRASASGGSSVSLNPAGLPLTRELVFEGGYGYRPGDGASTVGVTACDSTVAAPGCFFYQYISSSPEVGGMTSMRRAHSFGANVARAVSPRVTIGITSRYFDYNSDLMGEEDASGFTFDAGTTIRITDIANLAVVGYNLWGEDSEQYPRAIATGATIRPSLQLAVGIDALWNLETDDGDSTGRYGGGVEYLIQSGDRQSGYPLRLGGLYDAQLSGTYVTAGIGLISQKLGLDIGARKEVRGGDELMILASMRIFGPRDVQGGL